MTLLRIAALGGLVRLLLMPPWGGKVEPTPLLWAPDWLWFIAMYGGWLVLGVCLLMVARRSAIPAITAWCLRLAGGAAIVSVLTMVGWTLVIAHVVDKSAKPEGWALVTAGRGYLDCFVIVFSLLALLTGEMMHRYYAALLLLPFVVAEIAAMALLRVPFVPPSRLVWSLASLLSPHEAETMSPVMVLVVLIAVLAEGAWLVALAMAHRCPRRRTHDTHTAQVTQTTQVGQVLQVG
ncbi:hypothetical protein KEM60_03192 [Austwickia sp. TVS 96-490-7B]|uniref:hypothetical protein n=1 Tax=Austwickia sp. TVS 96-490-7B TaxID=2830843 RepID=UPI001C57B93B|nr:hypothetical protein [Austwickia sp. TVS 96-490-7B]MBW3086963.1 hypothetical protein [Austwickia sp. TVS 96-490-7B]